MANGENTIPAERGTALWAFSRMKSDALPALMDDLLERQAPGILPEQCKEVQNAIGKMVNAATSIPDRPLYGFGTAIWQVHQKFEETYMKWNEPKDDNSPSSAEHRRKQLIKLRKLRHKIAQKTRRHGHIIANDLDLQLIEDVYEALGGVVKSGPEVFTSLAKAVERFSKRMGGGD